jgi:hypothetical protein
MNVRNERTWCERCQAPEVHPDNVPLIDLFLDALPVYQLPGMAGGGLMEGFDRGAMPGLMDLHAIPADQRPAAWEAMREMEAEFRSIRAAKAPKAKP